jgi:hypothetical protein
VKVVQDDSPKVDFFPVTDLNISVCGVVSDQKRRLTKALAILLAAEICADDDDYNVSVQWLKSFVHDKHVTIINSDPLERVTISTEQPAAWFAQANKVVNAQWRFGVFECGTRKTTAHAPNNGLLERVWSRCDGTEDGDHVDCSGILYI